MNPFSYKVLLNGLNNNLGLSPLGLTGPESGRLYSTVSPPKINEAPPGCCEESSEVRPKSEGGHRCVTLLIKIAKDTQSHVSKRSS